MRAYNFGARGSNLTKFFQVTCREAGMITWIQFLGELNPLEFGRAKTVQNLVRFRATSHAVRSRISPEGMKTYRQAENGAINYNPSYVRWKKKTGKVWSTNKKSYRRACWPTQSQILRKTIFRRLFPPYSFPSLPFPPSPPGAPLLCPPYLGISNHRFCLVTTYIILYMPLSSATNACQLERFYCCCLQCTRLSEYPCNKYCKLKRCNGWKNRTTRVVLFFPVISALDSSRWALSE